MSSHSEVASYRSGIAPLPAGNLDVPRLKWLAWISMWAMSIMVFTMPRLVPTNQWEPLDLVKLCILGLACVGGTGAVMMHWSSPMLRKVLEPLAAFYLFLAWALLSTLWSPLRSVTVSQSGGLVAMLTFTTVIALLSTDAGRVKKILQQLNWVLLASSSIVLVAYLIDPMMSGLDRHRIHSGGDGLIHPTAAGATASLGLVLMVLCHWVGRYPFAGRLVLPCLVVHGIVLLLSNSRTALIMAMVTIGPVLFWYSTNRRRALAIFSAGVIAFAVLVIDPGFEILSSTAKASTQYVTRGQSGEQLAAASGRAEMWEAIWGEFKKSMFLGHGYFVSSETGVLRVWNESHNYTAHNLLLQILVSTGAIGLLIFLIALAQIFATALELRKGNAFQRRILLMVLLLTVWFFGWSQLGDSFLGPIRPESILFFTWVGIAIGQWAPLGRGSQDEQSRQDEPTSQVAHSPSPSP